MTSRPARRLRVLESVAAPGPTVKYVDQVVRYAPDDVAFSFFSWKTALFGRYEVFHVHWPEFLVRDKSPRRDKRKQLLFRLLLMRLTLFRTRVVRTVHNLQPHGGITPVQERLLARLDGITSTWVHLNGCTPSVPGSEVVVIPHGDYQEQLGVLPARDAVPGRFLFIGRIEPYKQVGRLIAAMQEAGRAGESLRIVGSAAAPLRAELETLLNQWPREDVNASARFAFVSDEEMVEEITAAECVVLPYSEMHNSGIALVALSLGRPVIVPDGCVNRALAEEVGDAWVLLFDGDFDAATIASARSQLARRSSVAPDLRGREWQKIAAEYARVFRGGGPAT